MLKALDLRVRVITRLRLVSLEIGNVYPIAKLFFRTYCWTETYSSVWNISRPNGTHAAHTRRSRLDLSAQNMFGGIPLALVLVRLSGDSSREGVETHSNTSRTHHRDWCICNLDLAGFIGVALSTPR